MLLWVWQMFAPSLLAIDVKLSEVGTWAGKGPLASDADAPLTGVFWLNGLPGLATADFSAPAEGAEPCCLPRWYALRFWRRCCELSKLACICCPACMGCCVPASQGGVRAGVANPRDGLVPKPPKPKSDADLLRASPSGLWGAAGDGTA